MDCSYFIMILFLDSDRNYLFYDHLSLLRYNIFDITIFYMI